MATVRSADYWHKRAINRSTLIEDHLDAQAPKIASVYNDAYRRINSDINTIWGNYAKDTGVDVGELKKLVSLHETAKTLKGLEGIESPQYIRENYAARITRLEQMKLQLHASVKRIYGDEVKIQTKAHAQTIKMSHLRTAYDIAQGTRVASNFTQINERRLNSMLQTKWQGANYSQRIWDSTDTLANDISQRIPAGLLAGQSMDRISREVRERFDVHKYEADRLIRTETTYFENQAELSLYKDLGVDKYVYTATLDSRTSFICGELDGQIFDIDKAVVGDNFPPLHPNCRAKVRAYLGADYEPTDRRIRYQSQADPNQQHSFVAPYQSYKDWAQTLAPIYSKIVPAIPAAGMIPTATPQITTIKNADQSIIDSLQGGMLDVAQSYPAAYPLVDNAYLAPVKAASEYKTLGKFNHDIVGKSSIIDLDGQKMQRLTFDKVETGITLLLHKFNRLPEQFVKVAERNVAKKFTVAETVKGYVYHESAHALDFTMSLSNKKLLDFYQQIHTVSGTKRGIVVPIGDPRLGQVKSILAKDQINPALAKTYADLKLTTTAQRNAYLKANIGKYASSSNQEAFSELFTALMQGSELPIVKAFKINLAAELKRLELDSLQKI